MRLNPSRRMQSWGSGYSGVLYFRDSHLLRPGRFSFGYGEGRVELSRSSGGGFSAVRAAPGAKTRCHELRQTYVPCDDRGGAAATRTSMPPTSAGNGDAVNADEGATAAQ